MSYYNQDQELNSKKSKAVETVLAFFESYSKVELPVLIFVTKKADCRIVASNLKDLLDKDVACITGDVGKQDREVIKDKFVSGKLDYVVSTSCWKTGLDIPRLKSVVNASNGSAPIGVKQGAGRGTRKDEETEKDSFTVYDLSLKSDSTNQGYRKQHYIDGGFEIASMDFSNTGYEEDVEDVEDEDLQTIFNTKKTTDSGRGRRKVETVQETVQELTDKDKWNQDNGLFAMFNPYDPWTWCGAGLLTFLLLMEPCVRNV